MKPASVVRFSMFAIFKVAVLASASASASSVWYVDAAKYGQSGLDGKTPSHAFGTIQDAIDNPGCIDGDTILVAPGVYDKGGATFDWNTVACSNRVLINKAITLKALSENPADTVIKGAKDPDPTDGNAYGIGPAAVRCVYVDSPNVTVKGFTLTDGACQALTGEGDIAAGKVGGFSGMSYANNVNVFAVDCVITNCSGARGGAMRYATAVRCVITDNMSHGGQSAARHVNAFHSIFVRNKGTSACVGDSILVNSAVVETASDAASAKTSWINSLAYANAGRPSDINTAEGFAGHNSAFQGMGNLASLSECRSGETYAFVAPMLGDYRLRKGSVAETMGSMARFSEQVSVLFVDVPAEVEIFKSLDGVVLDADSNAAIAAGPYQKGVETFGGFEMAKAQGDVGCSVNGGSVFNSSRYVFGTEYPSVVAVQLHSDTPLHRIDRDAQFGGHHYPDMSNVVHCAIPPTGVFVTNKVYAATKVIYVNPAGVDDDSQEGRGASAAKPFQTLQYAVDRAQNRTVIMAAEGTYDRGGKFLLGCSNRVAVSGLHLRILGAGAEKTVIAGASDPSDPANDGYGRGSAAMRCLCMDSGNTAVQGFSLEGGRSNYNANNATGNISTNLGGCVYANNVANTLLDCKLSDGVAYRGSLIAGPVSCIRTKFTGAKSIGGGVIRSASLYSCLIAGNLDKVTIDSATMLYHSTAVRNTDAIMANGMNLSLTNSIVVGAKDISGLGAICGSVLYGFSSVTPGENFECDYVLEDPVFVNAGNCDFRVGAVSPALDSAVLAADWWKLPVSDFNSKPFRFIGGKPVAGAFAYPVAMVIAVANDHVAIAPSGTNFVEAGESVTFTASNGEVRPVRSIFVNGEALEEGALQYSYKAPDDGFSTAPVAVEAVPITDFYVDAENGNDNNDGFSAASAKQTLAAVMGISGLGSVKGDTVHAASGDYDNETMDSVNGSTIKSRVKVPSGVTLVADSGPESTFIVGKAATSPEGYGCGSDAVRCASVCAGGVLKGFTLKDGRVGYGTGENANYMGAGVLAANAGTGESDFPRVENCVFTGNVAGRGGAGYGKNAIYVNCRFAGNTGIATSSAIYYGMAYGCYFDGNIGNQLARYVSALRNCTITDGNLKLDGISEMTNPFPDFGVKPYDTFTPVIDNCVLLCEGANSAYIANSIVVKGKIGSNSATDLERNILVDSVEAAKIGENGVPLKDSPAVDMLDADEVPAMIGDRDASLGQRIYNCKADLGAFEYDWRNDYAAYIEGKKAQVPYASKDTELDAGGNSLVLKDGMLEVVLLSRATGSRTQHSVPFQVLGDGVLTLVFNESETNTYTSADGAISFDFRNSLENNSIVFRYSGSDEGVLLGAASRSSRAMRITIR